MSYLCWLCLSLPLGVCRRAHVLFVLVVLSCVCRRAMSYLCWLCLSLPLFVGGHMSYLCWLCLSLPLGVCRRAHVLFVLVGLVFTSRCL